MFLRWLLSIKIIISGFDFRFIRSFYSTDFLLFPMTCLNKTQLSDAKPSRKSNTFFYENHIDFSFSPIFSFFSALSFSFSFRAILFYPIVFVCFIWFFCLLKTWVWLWIFLFSTKKTWFFGSAFHVFFEQKHLFVFNLKKIKMKKKMKSRMSKLIRAKKSDNNTPRKNTTTTRIQSNYWSTIFCEKKV